MRSLVETVLLKRAEEQMVMGAYRVRTKADGSEKNQAEPEPKGPDWRPKVAPLHADGMCDGEIARALGVSRTSVCQERQRQGLRPHQPKNIKPRPLDWEKRLRGMHARGWSDAKIGRALEMDKSWVRERRNELGLPKNCQQGAPRKEDA